MHSNCLEKPLVKSFSRYGSCVGAYPVVFLVLSLGAAVGLGVGFIHYAWETDQTLLYTPEKAEWISERNTSISLFPANNFSSLRQIDENIGVSLILTSRIPDNNILTALGFIEVLLIDAHVKAMNISVGGIISDYTSLCIGSSSSQGCDVNPVIVALNSTSFQFNFDFPIHSINQSYGPVLDLFLGYSLGGVISNTSTGSNLEAKAWKFEYFLKTDNATLSKAWIDAFMALDMSSYSTVAVVRKSSSSVADLMYEWMTDKMYTIVGIAGGIVLFIAIVTSMSDDAVRSKSLLGVCCVLNSSLSIIAGFGLLLYFKYKLSVIVFAAVPFTFVTIMHSGYVVMASWKDSNISDSVETRMTLILQECGVPLLMNLLITEISLCSWMWCEMEALKLFCIFSAVSIGVGYVLTMTFLASCTAVFGYLEAANRHSVLCNKVYSRQDNANKSYLYICCCTGGTRRRRKSKYEPKNLNSISTIFDEQIGWLLATRPARIIVLQLYLVYLGLAAYGCTKLYFGEPLDNWVYDNTYLKHYYNVDDKYFSTYGDPIQLIFTSPVAFHDSNARQKIEDLMNQFENETEYFYDKASSEDDQWTRKFENYNTINLTSTNVNSAIDAFLANSAYSRFSIDIGPISSVNGEVSYLRTTVRPKQFNGISPEGINTMNKARQLAKDSNLNVTVYHRYFEYYDRTVYVISYAWKTAALTAGALLVVPLLLIPRPLHACMVAWSAYSLAAGVVGVVGLWGGVRGDLGALLAFLVGACVASDISGHVIYAAAVDGGSTPANRLRSALCARGCNALQAFLTLGAVAVPFAWAPVGVVKGAWLAVMLAYAAVGAVHVIVVQSAMLASLPNNYDEMRMSSKPRPPGATPPGSWMYDRDPRRYSTQSRRLSAVGPPRYLNHSDMRDEGLRGRRYSRPRYAPYDEFRGPPSSHHAHLQAPPTVAASRPFDFKLDYRDRLTHSRDISQLSPGNRLYSPPEAITRQPSSNSARRSYRHKLRQRTLYNVEDKVDYNGWTADLPSDDFSGRNRQKHILPNIKYNDRYI